MLNSEELNGENNEYGDQQDDGLELELEERKAAIRKGKRPMSELYELKLVTAEEVLSPTSSPKFSNLEIGETSENELKEEYDNEYDYDQDLAILKSMYHYYFNHGLFPYYITDELINYIEDLIPNLKFRGHALATRISMIRQHFLTLWERAGEYYRPETILPVYREFYDLSTCLWIDFSDYYPVNNGENEEQDAT